jgi:hypothetical protein
VGVSERGDDGGGTGDETEGGRGPARLLIVDDHDFVRSGIRVMLSANQTSRSLARRQMDKRRWSCVAASGRTSCSWTCGCRAWTGSLQPDR